MPTVDRYSSDAPAECDVAIVGGGFSGLMSLVRLAQCAPKCQCVVFERRPLAAPGVAYGACDGEHLLNVPAARMGVFADRPTGFHEWLERNTPGRYRADEFVPRALFGRYLAESVSQFEARREVREAIAPVGGAAVEAGAGYAGRPVLGGVAVAHAVVVAVAGLIEPC